MKSPAAEAWWGEGTPPGHWQERFGSGPVTGLDAAIDADGEDLPMADPTPVESGRRALDVDAPDPTPVVTSAAASAQPVEVDPDTVASGRPSGRPSDGAFRLVESGAPAAVPSRPRAAHRTLRDASAAFGAAPGVRPNWAQPGEELAVATHEPSTGEQSGTRSVTAEPGRTSGAGPVTGMAPSVTSLDALTPTVRRAALDAMVIGAGPSTPVPRVEPPVGRSVMLRSERGGWPELPPEHVEEIALTWTPDQILRLRAEHRS